MFCCIHTFDIDIGALFPLEKERTGKGRDGKRGGGGREREREREKGEGGSGVCLPIHIFRSSTT